MKTYYFSTVVVIAACVAGCNRKPPEPAQPAPAGIEINAPGVHVEAGGGKGLDVEAPGVSIKGEPVK